MTQQEIQERNKQIALMLGLNPLTKSPLSWLISLKYHSDWNWLMEAVEFIESLIDKLPNGIFVKINTGGCFIHPINDTKDYITKVYQAGKTKKEAVFTAVSDFAKLFNEKKL
jgi:hypothetical protein